MSIYYYTYKYTNDNDYNLGYDALEGAFIGTEEEFKEYCQEESGQGFEYWDLEKRPATPEEIKNYEEYRNYWNFIG